MASGKYEALSQLFLNWFFNGGTFTQPTTLYIALFTTTPAVASTGTEATGGGYARLAVTCNTTNWPTITSATTTISNGATQTMFTATGSVSSAANMTGAGIMSALTAGTLYYFGDLTVAKPIATSDTPSFAIGALTIQEL